MVTEYFVCYGSSTSELKTNVDKAIKNGWQPLGGVAVSIRFFSDGNHIPEHTLLYQAVVKSATAGAPVLGE